MDKLKSFPPNFPRSKYLSKKWWHKIIWFLSFLFALSSLYSFILMPFTWLFPNYLGSFGLLLTYPMFPALLTLFLGWQGADASQINNSGIYLNSVFNNPYVALAIIEIYFFVLIFLPGWVYKIFLNAILGKKWRA